jgi:hypothetical protein
MIPKTWSVIAQSGEVRPPLRMVRRIGRQGTGQRPLQTVVMSCSQAAERMRGCLILAGRQVRRLRTHLARL